MISVKTVSSTKGIIPFCSFFFFYVYSYSLTYLALPGLRASQVALVVKNPPANAGDTRDRGLIPGLGWSPVGGHGNLFQYCCLENPMDRGAWRLQSIRSQRVRHNWRDLAHIQEKAMATHSSILAWRIPGMEEPDGLPSMGSHRVGHDWSDLAAAAAAAQTHTPGLRFGTWYLQSSSQHAGSFLAEACELWDDAYGI